MIESKNQRNPFHALNFQKVQLKIEKHHDFEFNDENMA
jgi:hypothetical protein